MTYEADNHKLWLYYIDSRLGEIVSDIIDFTSYGFQRHSLKTSVKVKINFLK